MAFTSSRTQIELLHPVDDSVLVDITTKGRSATVSRRPSYGARGYHRDAGVTAARLRNQGTIALTLGADDLALLHELERWQKGVVWYPMASDLKGKRYRQPNLKITFLDAQGAVEEVVTAYGVKLSDEALDLPMGPARETINLEVLGGFSPKEGGYEPVRALDFHRTGSKTYIGPDGTLKTAGDGVAAFGLPWVVRRNLLTNSNNLAAWSVSGTPVLAYNQAQDPIGGNTLAKLTDDSASVYEYYFQNYTIANDSGSYTASAYFLKESAPATFPELRLYLINGTTQQAWITLNTATGATYTRSSTGTVSVAVDDLGFVWRLKVTVQNNASGNTTAQVALYPAMAPANNIAAGSSATTGSCFAGFVMLNEGSTALPYQPTNATGVDVAQLGGLVLEGGTTNLLSQIATNGSNIATGTDTLATTAGFNAGPGTLIVNTSTLTSDTAQFFQGLRSLKVVTPGTSANEGVEINIASLAANTDHSASLRIKGTAGVQVQFLLRDVTNATTTTGTFILTGGWDYLSIALKTGVSAVTAALLTVRTTTALATTFWLDTLQLEASPFPTSWVDGTRQPDLCGIVPPHNELMWSHDLTKSAWVPQTGTTIAKVGGGTEVTFPATSSAIRQPVSVPGSVVGVTRTVAVRLKLGTLSGSVRVRLINQSGTQIASTTISTTDLHATDARTFYVTGTPGAGVTSIQAQIIGLSGTGTVIVESVRLVQGSHPGMEVLTTDTPIPAPVSPALDPACSQNGRMRFRVLPPPISTGKYYHLIGSEHRDTVTAGTLRLYRSSSAAASSSELFFDRKHNASTGYGGAAGRGLMSFVVASLWDGAPHDVVLEWTNEIRESDGVREMWMRIWVDGVLVASQDVAALYGATAWAPIDPSRLISDGNVFAVLSMQPNGGGAIIEFPARRAGYRWSDAA